jgi:hypothetical protein
MAVVGCEGGQGFGVFGIYALVDGPASLVHVLCVVPGTSSAPADRDYRLMLWGLPPA